ncbi:hypothetical protein B5X24_HaOG214967 [Helicoverpa armigera]|nr:hypothetical protein B5X24_HaOG214967 [Helicoverpa armigera]
MQAGGGWFLPWTMGLQKFAVALPMGGVVPLVPPLLAALPPAPPPLRLIAPPQLPHQQPGRKSTAGHRPLQVHATEIDFRLLASSSCQPSCASHHSTVPEDVLHYVCRGAASTLELVYPNGYRFFG